MRLNEALEAFRISIRGELTSETQRWYDYRLRVIKKYFTNNPPLEEIDAQTLRDYRLWLIRQEYAPHTLHSHIRAIKRIFRWLHEEGYISENPAERLRTPPLPEEPPKAISESDLSKILQEAAKKPRDYALICFLADTGCRLSGLVRLRLHDLDLENLCATVQEKGRYGRRRLRKVYFGHQTAEALRQWLAVRPDTDDDHVFLGQRGPLTPSGVYQLLRRLAKQAGVKGRFNPHAFRHGWARHALKRGADLGTVAQILGHTDITVTHRHYARWAGDELAALARRFSPLANGSENAPELGGPVIFEKES